VAYEFAVADPSPHVDVVKDVPRGERGKGRGRCDECVRGLLRVQWQKHVSCRMLLMFGLTMLSTVHGCQLHALDRYSPLILEEESAPLNERCAFRQARMLCSNYRASNFPSLVLKPTQALTCISLAICFALLCPSLRMHHSATQALELAPALRTSPGDLVTLAATDLCFVASRRVYLA
jgi:hypothetical protein